jgi:cell wall-associated NlpC family hydrolase
MRLIIYTMFKNLAQKHGRLSAMMVVWILLGLGAYVQADRGATQEPAAPAVEALALGDRGLGGQTVAQRAIVNAALKLAYFGRVPYLFGGKAVGGIEACDACRNCQEKSQQIDGGATKTCHACLQCGLDCSHFVERVFTDAKLKFRYADTVALFEMDSDQRSGDLALLELDTGLVNLEPGDLLLERGHMVLVIGVDHHAKSFDFVHATAQGRLKAGGIEIVRQEPIKSYQTKVLNGTLKVLRHTSVEAELRKGAADEQAQVGRLGGASRLWAALKF